MWTYMFCTTTERFHERGAVMYKSHRDIRVLRNLIYDLDLVVSKVVSSNAVSSNAVSSNAVRLAGQV